MNYIISGSLLNEFAYCSNIVFFDVNKVKRPQNENISIGKIYDNENNKIRLPGLELDGINLHKKEIYEYKKNKTNEIGDRLQLLFYLKVTNNLFKNFKGYLIYIERNEKIEVILNKENDIFLENYIKELELFISKAYFDESLKMQWMLFF